MHMHMHMHLHLHLHLHLLQVLQVLVLSMSLMVLVSLPSTLAEVETGLDWGTGLSAGRGLPGVLGAWHNLAVAWSCGGVLASSSSPTYAYI